MKAVIFNGSPQDHAVLEQADGLLLKELNRLQWETVSIPLSTLRFTGCKGCFHCWFLTPGLCRVRDEAHSLSRHLAECDLLALVTPVSFGGYGSILKAALDRILHPHLLPFLIPRWGEVRHPPRYGRRFRLLALGGLPKEDPESEEIFQTLVRRNALHLSCLSYASTFVYDYMTPKQVDQRIKNLAGKMECAV